jgi:hypothetical protein
VSGDGFQWYLYRPGARQVWNRVSGKNVVIHATLWREEKTQLLTTLDCETRDPLHQACPLLGAEFAPEMQGAPDAVVTATVSIGSACFNY